MLKYFKKVASSLPSSTNSNPESSTQAEISESPPHCTSPGNERFKEQSQIFHGDSELPELPSDPGKQPKITDYNPNIHERVRRHYLLKEPYQPNVKNFPQRLIDGVMRRFNRKWFDDHPWLEHIDEHGDHGGGDTFVGTRLSGLEDTDKAPFTKWRS